MDGAPPVCQRRMVYMRGSVRGCVVLANTGMPAVHATISAVRRDGIHRDVERLTDDAGGFYVDALPAGRWVLSAAGPGIIGAVETQVFDNALSEVTIEVGDSEPEPYRDEDSDLPPRRGGQPLGGTVRGRVVRADNGSAVANASVTVLNQDGTQADIAPMTDSAGDFVLEALPPGAWVVRAIGSTGETGQATVHVFDNALSEVTIELPATPSRPHRRNPAARPTGKGERNMPGSVRGRVERADNRTPVPDVAISVVSGAGPAPDIAPLTNADGRFALDGLPAGEWVLQGVGPYGETGTVTIQVQAGAVAEAVITLSSPSKQ
jgi:Carboxypeptidase regulatory-like domain